MTRTNDTMKALTESLIDHCLAGEPVIADLILREISADDPNDVRLSVAYLAGQLLKLTGIATGRHIAAPHMGDPTSTLDGTVFAVLVGIQNRDVAGVTHLLQQLEPGELAQLHVTLIDAVVALRRQRGLG